MSPWEWCSLQCAPTLTISVYAKMPCNNLWWSITQSFLPQMCIVQGQQNQGARGALAPPIFDLRTQTLCADDRLLRSLSRQSPQSYFCSAATGIVLQAVLLKCNTKLAPRWRLIWVNFDPIQEIAPKVGGWRSFMRQCYHVTDCTCKLSSGNVPCVYTQSNRINAKALGSLKWVAKPSATCVERLTKMFPVNKTVPLKWPDVLDPLEDCVALSAQKKKEQGQICKVIVIPKNASSAVTKGNKWQKLVDEKRVETIEM